MRILIVLFTVMILLFQNVCYANISMKSTSIAGISYGDSYRKVLQIYGKPEKVLYNNVKFKGDDQPTIWLRYKNGLNVFFLKRNEMVIDIIAFSPALKTADGLSVNMSMERVFSLYGQADYTRKYQNRTLYAYRAVASNGDVIVLEFDDEHGFIKQIEVHLDDGEDSDSEIR